MSNPVTRTIGRLLSRVHAGDDKLAWMQPGLAAPETIELTSPAFADGADLPHSAVNPDLGGGSLCPPLAWSGVPDGTAELVLIVQDPDAPLPSPPLHGLVTAIPPTTRHLGEGLAGPGVPHEVHGGAHGYTGPKPPPGHGTHRYIFQLYAADSALALPADAKLDDVIAALSGHVLARGHLTGLWAEN